MRLGELRVELRRLAIRRQRRDRVAAVAIGTAEVVVRAGALRRKLGRAAQQRDRLVELAALGELAAQAKARIGRLRRRRPGAEQPLQHAGHRVAAKVDAVLPPANEDLAIPPHLHPLPRNVFGAEALLDHSSDAQVAGAAHRIFRNGVRGRERPHMDRAGRFAGRREHRGAGHAER
jgi:hypothetical protein